MVTAAPIRRPSTVGCPRSEVEYAIERIRAGHVVVVVDDRGEGCLVHAAENATAELMSFTIRHSSGFLYVALDGQRADRLGLPLMWSEGTGSSAMSMCVTVDCSNGCSTGISAADRARTTRSLASPQTLPEDLTRPGHVVPLRAHPDGVLRRRHCAEAAVDLATLAGLSRAAALADVVSPARPTRMAGTAELCEFVAEHDLAMVSIAELVGYRVAKTVKT